MVEGLAARLEGGGGTLEEWQRLIRARTVLNERDKAAAHLEAARKALGGDADALAKLDQLARSVGLLPQP
jgi:cytochrome c-type biogenesis protein CcmH